MTSRGGKKTAKKEAPAPKRGGRGRPLSQIQEDSEMASEDNDDDNEESSSSSEEEEVKRPAPRGCKPHQQAMVVDQQEDLEDEEEKFEGTWEEYCYVCQDGGNVMCC